MPPLLTVALPPNLELWDSCVIRISGIDPATGDEVTGIQIQDVAFEIDNQGSDALAYGPFMLVTGPHG